MTTTSKAQNVMATLGLKLAAAMGGKAAPRQLRKAELLKQKYAGCTRLIPLTEM
jgi:hypothetical protein